MFDYFAVKEFLKSEPDYRWEQVKKALFQNYVSGWDEVTTLPQELRTELRRKFPLGIKADILESKDKRTAKGLLTLDDREKIETVLMQHAPTRNTVCVSAQIGCPIGCTFCQTGQMEFVRNLTISEILNQVLLWGRYLKQRDSKSLVTNLVFMGMGEPFLNFDNVIRAVLIFNDREGFNIGARKISISTIGIPEGIRSLAKEPLQVNLAVSLHAPTNKIRSRLVSANKKYPIQVIMNAVDYYIEKTNRKVMFEYLLLAGINDSEEQAEKLSQLLSRRLCMVNLIAYNPTSNNFSVPSARQIETFKQVLEKNGITVALRKSYGQDIQAACGQLAVSS
ncbi:MAG: 23S rRNA (adenine(2503)-C(2))-methyltransferase RlmN [Patescibacteria group bacterium]|nr:23S rRNA (adenine(2503)-C(2))-methyltransferase RlmN [Patescibacteria group bacterium]